VLQATFTDIDAFTDTVRGWDLDWRQLDGGPLKAGLLQIASERAALTRVGFSRQFLQTGGVPPGVQNLAVLGEGVDGVRWCGGRPAENDICVFPRTDYESVSRPGFRVCTLSFLDERLAVLAEALGVPQALDRLAEPGRTIECDPRAITEIRSRLGRLCRAVRARPELALRPAVRYELEFEVPAAILLALAPARKRRPRPLAARRAAALRRALGFIEEHRHEPLRVRELCAVAGVSWRTLDYAFQDRFSVSPKRYLTSLRLQGVRRDLRRAPDDAKVADIANLWGYWHLGKFAADYRDQFRELPSLTLGRATNGSATRAAGPLSPRAEGR
jgi:AraC family ethanolamine operon transcriptional activator